jgi:anhydro-N-acetylmuramic acid kinase
MADAVLFASRHDWRALQNLGGIANVTIVPPAASRGRREKGERSKETRAQVRAFDTGPGVMVIDGVVRTLHRELRYDEDGALARRGRVIPGVVEELLGDPYFVAEPPKTTGRERFGAAYVAAFISRCRGAAPGATDADLVATAVSLTARSVGHAYRRFVPQPIADVLISGGGARNPALVEALASALAPRRVRRFDDRYFDGEAKEAVAFALLGALHLAGLPGNIPTATGARGPRLLGKLTPGTALSASRSGTRSR